MNLICFDLSPRVASNLSENWIVIVLLLIVLLIIWLRVNYPLRFKLLFDTVVNVRMLKQNLKDEAAQIHRSSIVFTFIFILSFSLLIFLIFRLFDVELLSENGLISFLQISAIVLSAYAIKLIGISIINTIIGVDFGLHEYRFAVFQLNKAVGVLLVPVVIIASYVSLNTALYCLLFGAIIVISFFLFRLIRGVTNSLQHQTPIFYIILYLCTLEILPVVLGVKVLFY